MQRLLGLIFCGCVSLTAGYVHAQEPAESPEQEQEQEQEAEPVFALDEEGRLVQFARDIAPVLRARCLQCHGPEDAKADFRVDDRDTLLEYLEPEDAESSMLYIDYLTIDDEDMLMPPRAHGGPLSAGELALISTWINEGADWPEDYALVAATEGASLAAESVATIPTSLLSRIWSAQGVLHPATVHFPIALFLLGGVFVVLGWKWPVVGTQIPLACLLIGAASSIAATLMGWSFAVDQGYGSWNRFDEAMMDREIFWHRWSGVIVTVLATIFAVVALLSLKKDSRKMTATWKAGLLVCASLVGLVGHQGGEMTYGEDLYPKAWRTLTGAVEIVEEVSVESPVAESEV